MNNKLESQKASGQKEMMREVRLEESASLSLEEHITRYVELKEVKEALEEEIRGLGALIQVQIQEDGGEAKKTDYGTFSLLTTPRWKYSEAVKTLENLVKTEKERERVEEIATKNPSTTLKFTPLKKEE